MAMTFGILDHLSAGRVDCGLDAGWHEVEAKAFGYEFPRIGVREDRGAIRSRSSAPPTWASISAPTPSEWRAAKPSSSRTSARTCAAASCAARPTRSWTWSPATATPAAGA